MDILFMIIMVIVFIGVAIFALSQMVKLMLALLATPAAKIIVVLIVVYTVYTYGKQLVAHFSFGTLGIILVSIVVGFFVLSLHGGNSYHRSSGYSSLFDDDDYMPKKKKKSAQQKKKSSYDNACPRCGAQMVWMPEDRRPTNEFNDYEEEERINDYSFDPDHPRDKTVKIRHHDRIYETIPAHYYCPQCGYGDK